LDRALAEFNAREAQLAKQTTEVEVAVREVSVWQQQLEDMVIRAPFAGIVTMKNAQPGEMISPISAGGGFTRTGIATIVDMTSLEIEVDVNESYLNRVRTAQPVEATLDAYPDWRIAAKVIAIIPTADRQKSTVKVRVGFEQLDPRILPDMAVKVAFRDTDTAGTAPALAVPKAAVQRVEGRDVVFVVQAGRAVLRPVKLGTPGPDEAVILSGLAAGERVITGGSGRLRDGLRVREPRP
jgi:RND family efflux transporter MFP subunit